MIRYCAAIILYGIFLALAPHLFAVEVEVIHLAPSSNMDRADLNYVVPLVNPKAVLILSPGCNGNGGNLIRSPVWQEFARSNNLGLVGLSFASPEKATLDGTGYYYASKGSGDKLLEGIRKIYGRDLPLLLYGFSGGAIFTSYFVGWKPERVLAWCAYSAGWWDQAKPSGISPPGIVACGEEDPRYGATLGYFKLGRAAGKPWLWVSLPKTGHQPSAVLDEFVREYFAAILKKESLSNGASGLWVDVDEKKQISAAVAAEVPSESGWIPNEKIFSNWSKIHEP